jgi:thioredoxin 1
MKTVGIIVGTILLVTIVVVVFVVTSVKKHEEKAAKTKHVISFNDANFQKEVVEASKTRPVLVDFYADWCLPCRFLEPILEEAAKEVGDSAVIGKVNSDENLIARRFRVTSIPVMFIIKDAEIKQKIDGLVPKETIVQALKEHSQ